MVWYCPKHSRHSIDDVCPDCDREPTIESLTAKIERLRVDNGRLRAENQALLAGPSTQMKHLEFEIERLKTDNERLLDTVKYMEIR